MRNTLLRAEIKQKTNWYWGCTNTNTGIGSKNMGLY